jgi:predicted dehydrogenase
VLTALRDERLIRLLRRHPTTECAPILAVVEAESASRAPFARADFDDVIAWPVGGPALGDYLRRVLVDLGVHLLDLGLTPVQPAEVELHEAELAFGQGQAVEDAAWLTLRLDGLPFRLAVSWQAERPETEIALELVGERGRLFWPNVDGSFYRFRALRDGRCRLDKETSLRADTLGAFAAALAAGATPRVDLRVYELIAEAYRRVGTGLSACHPERSEGSASLP